MPKRSLQEIDACLQELRKSHPWRVNALIIGLSLLILTVAALFRWVLERLPNKF